MKGGSARWWLLASSTAVLTVVAVLVVSTHSLVVAGTRGAEKATVYALPVAVLSLLATVVFGVLALRHDDRDGPGARLTSEALRLAGEVRQREASELARLVADTGDAQPAEVGFVQPELLFWRTDGGDRDGTLSEIADYYRGLGRGRLALLGPAGSGKTVLAIQLVRDLAAVLVDTASSHGYATAGRMAAVPVRMSAPAFDVGIGQSDLAELTAEQLAARFDTWLVGQLSSGYGVREKTAAALVAAGRILPVLDGVDEMDPADAAPRRAAALMAALNHPTPHGARAMVLTCRAERYHQLTTAPAIYTGQRDVAQDATVVEVQPLTPTVVRRYLCYRFPDSAGSGRAEPRWRPVLKHLTQDRGRDPVVAALRSPLLMFLAVTAYRDPDTDPSELLTYPTAAQLRHRLFHGLVPAITSRYCRPRGGHYQTEQVTRWLTTLAHHLRTEQFAGRSGTDLRLDQLWRAAGDRAPRYGAAAILITIQAALLRWMQVHSLARMWPPHTMRATITTIGLAVGLGFVVWCAPRRAASLQRLNLRQLRTTAGQRRLAAHLVGGLAVGLALGLAGGIALGLAAGIVGGIAATIAFGLAFGLASRPDAITMPSRLVTEGIAHTTALLVVGIAAGLVSWPGLELAGGLAPGLGLAGGLTVGLGLADGLALGLIFVAPSPWPRYALACPLLALRGQLPLRPAVFLDWAYGAGLMRLSGIAVQFRHREFQDWLLRDDRSIESTPLTVATETAPTPDGTENW